MGDVSQTKTCPLCAETIKAAAKVCPFCQGRQSRFALWRAQLPQLLAGLVLLTIFGLTCPLLLPKRPGGGRSFPPHRDELRVLRTSLEPGRKAGELCWLKGLVTNAGSYPWRVQQLELRFLDARGNLVDVRHSAPCDGFVVPPGGESAFRVKLDEVVLTNTGVVHQVRVQTAIDGNLPPD